MRAAGTAAGANAAATAKRISARERLLHLPVWFSLGMACDMTGVPKETLQVYLHRWKKMGVVESFGLKTGVYFNRVLEPKSRIETRVRALKWLYPEAMLVGDTILNAAGWTTQIPRQLHVAIIDQRTAHRLNGVRLHLRSRSWFARACRPARAGRGLVPAGQGETGLALAELRPAWALADQIRRGQEPDADDLEWDEIDAAAVLEAGKRLGARESRILDYLKDCADCAANFNFRGPGNR